MCGREHAFSHPPFYFYFCACRLSGRQEKKVESSHAEARSTAAQMNLPNRRSVAAKGSFPLVGITQNDPSSHSDSLLRIMYECFQEN